MEEEKKLTSQELLDDEGTLIEEEPQAIDDDSTLTEDNLNGPQEGTTKVEDTDLPIGYEIEGFKVVSLLRDKTPSGQAQLYKAEKDGKFYVIKLYFHGKRGVDENVRQILLELQKETRNIAPTIAYGSIPNDGRNYEITPFFKNGTLKDHRGDELAPIIRENIIKEINEVLHMLHERGIIHGDIKPSNIFFSNGLKHPIVGDFDISRFLNGREVIADDVAMSEKFAAPEVMNRRSVITTKSDYYSFGMTIRAIAHNQDDYFDNQNIADIVKLKATTELLIPEDIPNDIRDLIAALTEIIPNNRADYEGVCNWLANNNYYNGRAKHAKFADDDVSIGAFDFEGTICHNSFELAEAFANNWGKAYKYISFKANGEFNLVNRLLVGAESKALAIRDVLDNPKYSEDHKVFEVIHILKPSIGMVYGGERFSSFKELMDKIYDDPNFFTPRGIFSMWVLRRVISEEGNQTLLDEIETLYREMEPDKYETWVDIILNYFRKEDCFFIGGRKSSFPNFIASLMENNSFKSYPIMKKKKEFLERLLLKQGKIEQKQVASLSNASSDAFFAANLVYALGKPVYHFKNHSFSTVQEMIELNNQCHESKDKIFRKEGEAFFDQFISPNGGFIYMINLEPDPNGDTHRYAREVWKKSHPSFRSYLLTAKEPKFAGNFTSIDELSKWLIAKDDSEEAINKVLNGEKFAIWVEILTKKPV
ncbi:MAG: protein kinase [Bacilli bacterium]|nr:protein kinase [Bacilli bacterium]